MRFRMTYILFMILLVTSCRKEICYNHDEHSEGIRVDVVTSWETVWERDYGCGWETCWNPDWTVAYEDLCPTVPEGLRVIAYHESGNRKEFNIAPEGTRIALGEEGEYALLFYNNDTEYIVYDDLSSLQYASATTRTRSRAGFRSPHDGEAILNQPDMLYGHYVTSHVAERKMETDMLEIELRPLVYTYYINCSFDSGFEYVSKAQGALAGMADMVYLHDGHTGPDSATLMFDCAVGESCLDARVMTFGIPDYPGDHYGSRADGSGFMLRLEVLLTNGLYKTFDVDIADQIENQPRGGVIRIDGLTISSEEGDASPGSGGFEVGVEGWGDHVNIPLN